MRFLSFEKGKACQSFLFMLRGKLGLSKPEVKKIGFVWSFLVLFDLKNLKFTLLKCFLAYLGSSVKTTNVTKLVAKFSFPVAVSNFRGSSAGKDESFRLSHVLTTSAMRGID